MKTTNSTYAYDDAHRAGFDAGTLVPCSPPSREQAWSDFRAEAARGAITYSDDPEIADEYIRGHMEGQEERQ